MTDPVESMARIVARLLGYNYDKLSEDKNWLFFWRPTRGEIRLKAIALVIEIGKREK